MPALTFENYDHLLFHVRKEEDVCAEACARVANNVCTKATTSQKIPRCARRLPTRRLPSRFLLRHTSHSHSQSVGQDFGTRKGTCDSQIRKILMVERVQADDCRCTKTTTW
jgi:hypothetical protein